MDEKQKLVEWVKSYARPMRGQKDRFIVDEFDPEFYLILNCEDAPEGVEPGTCDVMVVPLLSDDPLAEGLPLLLGATKQGVQSLFAALGSGRFKAAIQESMATPDVTTEAEDAQTRALFESAHKVRDELGEHGSIYASHGIWEHEHLPSGENERHDWTVSYVWGKSDDKKVIQAHGVNPSEALEKWAKKMHERFAPKPEDAAELIALGM